MQYFVKISCWRSLYLLLFNSLILNNSDLLWNIRQGYFFEFLFFVSWKSEKSRTYSLLNKNWSKNFPVNIYNSIFLIFFVWEKLGIDIFKIKGKISLDIFINISYLSIIESISLKIFVNISNASFLSLNSSDLTLSIYLLNFCLYIFIRVN